MKKILLAVRDQERDSFLSVLDEHGYLSYIVKKISDLAQIPSDIRIAFIDEDFCGDKSGWQLSKIVRQSGLKIKVVMIVRDNPRGELLTLLYDVTMRYPLAEEEIVGEIERFA